MECLWIALHLVVSHLSSSDCLDRPASIGKSALRMMIVDTNSDKPRWTFSILLRLGDIEVSDGSKTSDPKLAISEKDAARWKDLGKNGDRLIARGASIEITDRTNAYTKSQIMSHFKLDEFKNRSTTFGKKGDVFVIIDEEPRFSFLYSNNGVPQVDKNDKVEHDQRLLETFEHEPVVRCTIRFSLYEITEETCTVTLEKENAGSLWLSFGHNRKLSAERRKSGTAELILGTNRFRKGLSNQAAPITYGQLTVGATTSGPGWRIPSILSRDPLSNRLIYSNKFDVPLTKLDRAATGVGWSFHWDRKAPSN